MRRTQTCEDKEERVLRKENTKLKGLEVGTLVVSWRARKARRLPVVNEEEEVRRAQRGWQGPDWINIF